MSEVEKWEGCAARRNLIGNEASRREAGFLRERKGSRMRAKRGDEVNYGRRGNQ